MQVSVRVFGNLREEAGESVFELELPDGESVSQLTARLAARLPSLAQLGPRLRVSINLEFVAAEAILHDGDEVALLPPVAGGSGRGGCCRILDEALDEAAVVERVAGPDIGGVVTFVGTVRDHARGQSIQYLEYEAYPEMAEREMEKIVAEAAERWPGTRVAISHRVGRLEIGEAAVVIAACAPHRGEAFAACQFCIDTLKTRVPIWKKEVAADGAYWVDDHA